MEVDWAKPCCLCVSSIMEVLDWALSNSYLGRVHFIVSLTKGRNFSGEQMFTLHLRHIMGGWSHNGGKGWSTFAPSQQHNGGWSGGGGRFSTLTTLSKHLCHRGKAEDMKTELQACKTFATEKTHRKRGSFAITYSCVPMAVFASILLRVFVCCSLGSRVETCLLVISRKCTCPMPLPFCYCARVTSSANTL